MIFKYLELNKTNPIKFSLNNQIWNVEFNCHSNSDLPFLKQNKVDKATAYIGLYQYQENNRSYLHMYDIIQRFYVNDDETNFNTNLPLILIQCCSSNKEENNIPTDINDKFHMFPIKKHFNLILDKSMNLAVYLKEFFTSICIKLNKTFIHIVKHQNDLYKGSLSINIIDSLIHKKYPQESIDKYNKNVLHHAVEFNNLQIIQKFNLNILRKQQDLEGNTPLHYAAQNSKYIEIFKLLLLLSDEETEIENQNHETPLFLAIKNSNESVISIIKMIKPHIINYVNSDDLTISQFAILNNQMRCLEKINEEFPDLIPSLRNHKGEDTLLYSIRIHNDNGINYCLKYEKPLIYPTNRDETILHYACLYHNPQIFNLFKECDSYNGLDIDLNYPIHIAAREGERKFVKYLMTAYPLTLKHKNNKNETPIQCALNAGHRDIVEMLLDNMNINDVQDEAIFSITKSSPTLLQKIPYTKIIQQSCDEEGFYPIHYIIKNGNDQFGELLQQIPKQEQKTIIQSMVNKQTKQNYTPLMIAIKYQKTDIIFSLLQNKADLKLVDNKNLNVLDYSLEYAQYSPLSYLFIEANLKCNKERDSYEYSQYLLYSQKIKNGWNHLHEALFSQNHESFNLINQFIKLEEKAPFKSDPKNNIIASLTQNYAINYIDMQYLGSFTPIHFSIFKENNNGAIKITTELLKYSSNINITSLDGWTYLFYAVKFRNKNLVNYLLDRKVDPNQQDNNGWTPLHISIMNQDKDISVLLRKYNARNDIETKDGKTANDLALNYFQQFLLEFDS